MIAHRLAVAQADHTTLMGQLLHGNAGGSGKTDHASEKQRQRPGSQQIRQLVNPLDNLAQLVWFGHALSSVKCRQARRTEVRSLAHLRPKLNLAPPQPHFRPRPACVEPFTKPVDLLTKMP